VVSEESPAPVPPDVQRAAPKADERDPVASPTPAAEKPTPKAATTDLSGRFEKLVAGGLSSMRGPEFGKFNDAIKASGKDGVDFLANRLRTSTNATERFLAGALLEAAGDADAVPALASVLKSDKDDMVRRMASHAIAVLGSPAAESPLRDASTGDSDWGVRVNSAYGLAKLGQDDGLKMLREAYESASTPPEYRLPILGGLADVAAPSTAPLFRKILTDTKDVSYLLMSIGALEKMKDAGAIPALEQVVQSSSPEMVKQAAAKAIDSIKK
jgi:HEAT repeat protein